MPIGNNPARFSNFADAAKYALKINNRLILCGACLILQAATANEDAFEQALTAGFCFICSAAFGKDAATIAKRALETKFKKPLKTICKTIHTAATLGAGAGIKQEDTNQYTGDTCPFPLPDDGLPNCEFPGVG